MIPTFNCAGFLAETIHSVLVQDMGEQLMQIEVVDDCSTDADIEELVQRVGGGRVGFYRQPQNVGSLRNFETCINRAQGIYVHLLHGDDKVKPGFYARIKTLFEQFPTAGAAFCRFSFIDTNGTVLKERPPEAEKDGILPNWLLRIAERQAIQFASIVVKREVYEKLGSFYGMTYGEDWEMWVRIAKHYPVAYTPELLAEYRAHDQSLTSHDIEDGSIIQHIKHALSLIQAHVPEEQRSAIQKKASAYYARVHITFARQMWSKSHNKSQVHQHIKAALEFRKSPTIFYHVLRLYGKMYLNL
jgi:glycosyltransferase involved in cell wall biosynthesis